MVDEAKRAYNRAYYKANKEKILARSRGYFKDYYSQNRERLLEYKCEHRKANAHKYASYAAKRRASKLKATPKWLTMEMLAEIEYKYFLAGDVSLISGEPHHVDHIVPLQGENICGLHVPWNLQILAGADNSSKSNKFKG